MQLDHPLSAIIMGILVFQFSVFLFYVNLLFLTFECLAQPAVGADRRKVDAQGNVILASNENMQYAVTVDVLQTVSKIVNTD